LATSPRRWQATRRRARHSWSRTPCLVWAKPDSTWAWTLAPLAPDRTRLVTRLRQRYRPTPAGLLTIILAEFGDFAMMRKMLLGIKARAEASPVDGGGLR
jgi:hypothetical protein